MGPDPIFIDLNLDRNHDISWISTTLGTDQKNMLSLGKPMIVSIFPRRVRPHLLERSIPSIMNYAAAAGGSRGPPQPPPQQHNDLAAQTKPGPNSHTQKPRSPRKQSPKGNEEHRRAGHVTREEHKPNTGEEEELVYVLTLKLTNELAKAMNSLREQHFPKYLNRTPAHLTLFHALPDSQFAAIDGGLSQLSANTKIFYMTAGIPFKMRQGVGIQVGEGYNNVKKIRAELQSQWISCLSEQDAGGSRPHWTVMNKVRDQKKIDEAFGAVEKELKQKTLAGEVTGLDLWRYDKGNWVFAKEYEFQGP